MAQKTRKGVDMDKVYSSSQALEKLGISPTTLKNLVDKEVIEKVVPPGYQRGYYTRASVDEYYEKQRLFVETYTSEKKRTLEVRKVTESDQEKIFEMEKEVLGVTVPLENRLEWWRKNPDIDFVARTDDEVFGHLSLIPLPKDILLAKLRREIYGRDMNADKIEAYQTGKQHDLFVMAMAVRKSYHNGSIYAALLLREAQKSLYELAFQGKLVRAIYATSRTRDGIYLAQRLGLE